MDHFPSGEWITFRAARPSHEAGEPLDAQHASFAGFTPHLRWRGESCDPAERLDTAKTAAASAYSSVLPEKASPNPSRQSSRHVLGRPYGLDVLTQELAGVRGLFGAAIDSLAGFTFADQVVVLKVVAHTLLTVQA